MLSESDYERVINSRFTQPVYSKLKTARIGVAGLGGMGSHAAIALARCGVGYLHIVDFDRVELSNLNRQMYTAKHIGLLKSDVMREQISEINPYITVVADSVKITAENAAELFSDVDIICEDFDVPEAKAMLVDAILEQCPDKIIVACSGMAGFSDGNAIETRKITDRFYLCGDRQSGLQDGVGLVAPRVMICAGHQALAAINIILRGDANNGR